MTAVRSDLPSGTVTFLFTDIEGSTRLLHELGAEAYADALAAHRRILREAFTAQGGVEVDTQGDAFFVAFPTAPGALRAAAAATDALAPGPIHVRMAIHTGTPYLGPDGYVGVDVHRGARIGAAGHGGQVLVSAATAALLGSDGLRDLGLHRLKDLSAPEHIYQLGTADFLPLKTLYQTNLPIPATPFLGREQELTEVIGLLSQDNLRVLTLTGSGGTGKTRLALQAAAELSEGYPQGVWWVPLAALREPRLVLETAARAVGGKGDLAEQIADRSMLLLFDNFEHVVEAATDLAGLVAACPNLDMLVTSREPLHVTGEQEYPVPPLLHDDGVELFVARARAVRPDFQADGAVSEICRRLDDLPLAIELAAARVKALSSKQLLERLGQRLPLLTGGARDLPERQRTLRATIAWSHDLLSPEEQRLFARLAVFGGGCTLEAAEEVTEADLDTIQSLVDKSLLRHTGNRFWMLETIREYAGEQLGETGESDRWRRRLADYVIALGERHEPRLREYDAAALDIMDREHDNVRAALDSLAEAGETQQVLRLAGTVFWYWTMRGHFAEGRRRLETALAADDRPTPARAKALTGAADMALDDGNAATARAHANEGQSLYRQFGDPWGIAYGFLLLGVAETIDQAWARGAIDFEEGLRLFRELRDQHFILEATRLLAWMYTELGDLDRSRMMHEANLDFAQRTGDRQMEGATLSMLAAYAMDEDRIADARDMVERALRLHQDLGDVPGMVVDIRRAARLLAMDDRPEAAATLLASAEELQTEKVGFPPAQWVVRMAERTLERIRATLDDATVADASERGRRLPLDEAVALALGELN